eukprot:Rhum_TRINITY_DN11864_c0_g1::Rhum_TRINITY_DN11864_c0_g1_i1::g.47502::m.47502
MQRGLLPFCLPCFGPSLAAAAAAPPSFPPSTTTTTTSSSSLSSSSRATVAAARLARSRRSFHADSRQRGWEEGNVRVANLGGRDRPVTPVRGPGAFETVRRALGRSTSGAAVLALVEESVAVAADGGGGPDSSVVGAAARRLGELGCGDELRLLLTRVLEEGGRARGGGGGGGGGERTRRPLQLGEVAAGAVLTALARCVRAAGGVRGAEALAMGRAVWRLAAGGDRGRLLSAPCYGAALHLCACVAPDVEASAWARGLYGELGPAANVLHLGCYLRVLAAAGEWAEVDRLWRDGVGGAGPTPNAACLAGVVGHAASPAALRALWAAYEPTVGGAEAWTAPLAAAPMARFLALGCPAGVLEVEARRLEVGCAAHVEDRFGNRRHVLRLWRCRALAHEALAAEAE